MRSIRLSGIRLAVVAAFVLLAAPNLSADVIVGPTLTLDPIDKTPLAALLELETDTPVQVELTISFGAEVQTVLFPDISTQHSLPVLGMKPDRTYSVDIELIPGGPLPTMFVTTDPLPADFPTLTVLTSDPPEMEPGLTMIDCFNRGSDPRPRWTVIIDHAGDVVWYSDRCLSAVRQLPNGKLIARINESLYHMDMLGNLVLTVLQDPGDGLHHDLEPTPHGTYLSLTRRSVEVEDYPTSDSDPKAPTQTATIRDEPVVEFFADGSLRREWGLVEMLDETRIGYGSLSSTSVGLDWVHDNAVIYDPTDDSIVVSGRHQDAVFKFSRETGELVWILGNHNNWSSEFQQYLLTPINAPFEWQYHQHAPMWTGAGTLLLFDNGNLRASPFDGTTPMTNEESYSRGVEFSIDDVNMTVEQLWEFGASSTPRLYSFFISDADWMEQTNNRLMTFGGTSHVDGVAGETIGRGPVHVRIIETTDETPATKVFDVEFYDPTGGRITAYRSERIPSLYPPQNIKAPNGIGNTLTLSQAPGETTHSWVASPTDADHSAAGYYMVYASSAPNSGFAITESIGATEVTTDNEALPIVYYKIVAGNVSGTSNDVPAP